MRVHAESEALAMVTIPTSQRRTCSFEGCPAEYGTRGLCGGHYRQWRIGKPLSILRTNLEGKFWSQVKKTDSCWVWAGKLTRHGYGSFSAINLRVSMAHRYSWILHNGPIEPHSLFVRHMCHNKRCVNPSHLALGTRADNTNDSVIAGHYRYSPERLARKRQQYASGEITLPRKLSPDDIQKIKAMRASGIQYKDIAAAFGTSPNYTSRVCRGVVRADR